MAPINQATLDNELRHWMRPDWRRYWKPGHENDPLYRLYESAERKYSPDQLRVPAGSQEGGQWTSEGGGGSREAVSNVTSPREPGKPATQIAGRISPQRRAECEEQLRQDTFICNTVRTARCWAQANFRYA